MKKKILLLTLGSMLSIPAFAVGHFAGHWESVSGKVSSNIGINSNCSKIEVVIVQDSRSLTTKSYNAVCGTYSADWGPVTEDLQGNKVLENGDVVGSITEDSLTTSAPDSGVLYNYNLKLTPGSQGLMHVVYGVQNFAGTITIEGDLKKVSDTE